MIHTKVFAFHPMKLKSHILMSNPFKNTHPDASTSVKDLTTSMKFLCPFT